MKRLVAVAATIALILIGGTQAAEWPAKPVKVVVAYAAAGANDLLARVFAERLSEAFGQQFTVENRTGGGGLIGAGAVARAEPDGYTLMASGMPSHVLAPAMNPKNAGFDPVRDFTHFAYLGGPPNVFVVHSSSPGCAEGSRPSGAGNRPDQADDARGNDPVHEERDRQMGAGRQGDEYYAAVVDGPTGKARVSV